MQSLSKGYYVHDLRKSFIEYEENLELAVKITKN